MSTALLSVEDAKEMGLLPLVNSEEMAALKEVSKGKSLGVKDVDEIGGLIRVMSERRLVREDTLDIMATVGTKYTVLQNDRVAVFLDTLLEAGDGQLRYEIAGSLNNGRRVWFLARLGDGVFIRRQDGTEDEMQRYLLAINYHDGRGSFKVLGTGIRVVCHNTMTAALHSASNVFALRHVGDIEARLEECKEALRLENNYFDEFQAAMARLDEMEFTADQGRDFAASAMTGQKEVVQYKAAVDAIRSDRTRARLVHDVDMVQTLASEGSGNRGDTAYDWLNGLTDFLDHHKERMKRTKDAQAKAQGRMNDIVFGDAAAVRQRALRMLTRD
jgi:phage/plasmid-like protein (TIGR03299 family)